MKSIFFGIIITFIIVFNTNATDYYSRSDGTWSTVSLNGTACGCTPPGGTTNDNFTVSHTITVSLTDITIKGTVIVNSGGSLTFTGDVTFHNNSDVTINDGGTFHVNGDFVNNNNSTDVVVNGSLEVDGDFTNSSNGEIVISSTGTVTIGGSCSNPGTVGESGTEITGCSGVNNPLPVELVSFQALFQDNKVILTWETASELNNDYFIIERSFSGNSFSEINRVQGNGTKSSKSEYEFTDTELNNGSYYYRLKQVDFDGVFEYSNVIYIQVIDELNTYLHIYPNPVNNGSTININYNILGMKNIVQLYDLKGIIVWNKTIIKKDINIQNNFQLESSDLPIGIFILRIIGSNQTISKTIRIQ